MGTIKGKALQAHTCPVCLNFSSKRLTSLESHFVESHNKTSQEIWDSLNGGPGKCRCGCDKTTTWIAWNKGYTSFINGHNGYIYAAYSEDEARRISEIRSVSLTGKTGWSKGLTKSSDARVAERAAATSRGRKVAFDEGRIEAWNKGATKSTDDRVAAAAEEAKARFASGQQIPWAKGLTKITDSRIATMAGKVSLSLQRKELRNKLDTMKRLSLDDVKRRVESTGDLEVIDGLQDYINDAAKVIVVKCKSCGELSQGSLRTLQYGKCFNCSPGGSRTQEEVAKFVESLQLEIKRNDRKELQGQELDIFVPSKMVAVEYNGLYWHSHTNKSSSYHNNKSCFARAAGIKLIHVFEDEWRDKRDIVKSIISAKLGLCTSRIGARKCSIRILTHEDRSKFFNANHLDGDSMSKIAWGLISPEGEVVYALSVRKPFHKRHDDGLEVARCAPKIGHIIPGGLSRLTKMAKRWCAEQGYNNLITYVDTRLGGTGNGYLSAGFKQSSVTPPRFWWTNFDDRFNRFKYRANSAEGLTEAQVAEAAGVVKIWGCENHLFVLPVSSQE